MKQYAADTDEYNICSILGESTQLNGQVSGVGSIKIEGCLKGKINMEGNIKIGSKANVEGEIIAKNLTVAGEVNGMLLAKNKLLLERTGRISANIKTGILVMEEGVRYSGSINMHNIPEQSQPPVL